MNLVVKHEGSPALREDQTTVAVPLHLDVPWLLLRASLPDGDAPADVLLEDKLKLCRERQPEPAVAGEGDNELSHREIVIKKFDLPGQRLCGSNDWCRRDPTLALLPGMAAARNRIGHRCVSIAP